MVDAPPDLTQLLELLPPQVKAVVMVVLQVLTILSIVLPLIEKAVAVFKSKKADDTLKGVQQVLSWFPRVQVPALSKPPAAAPQKLAVQWPDPKQISTANPALPPPPPLPSDVKPPPLPASER